MVFSIQYSFVVGYSQSQDLLDAAVLTLCMLQTAVKVVTAKNWKTCLVPGVHASVARTKRFQGHDSMPSHAVNARSMSAAADALLAGSKAGARLTENQGLFLNGFFNAG